MLNSNLIPISEEHGGLLLNNVYKSYTFSANEDKANKVKSSKSLNENLDNSNEDDISNVYVGADD